MVSLPASGAQIALRDPGGVDDDRLRRLLRFFGALVAGIVVVLILIVVVFGGVHRRGHGHERIRDVVA